MKQYDPCFTDINMFPNQARRPDFNNLLKILHCQKPDRPTLFEFFLNDDLYLRLARRKQYDTDEPLDRCKVCISAYATAGYDYTTVNGSDFTFEKHGQRAEKTISLNEGYSFCDRESFEKYKWNDPDDYDYSRLETLAGYLPEGMKLIVYGPGGVLENVIALVGFSNLCYLLADDVDLVEEIFDAVGSRLLRYYEICSPYPAVGALISNDDWGFNTQTMLSVNDMRKYVMPWHRKIVETIHASGKPAILHSCGNLDAVMGDIIDDLKYDAKHSYEDKIKPVEIAYEESVGRIAVLGGLDMNFICTSTPEEVYNRAVSMIERASRRGGYALGSGNSIPYYVPQENYLAMIAAAVMNSANAFEG